MGRSTFKIIVVFNSNWVSIFSTIFRIQTFITITISFSQRQFSKATKMATLQQRRRRKRVASHFPSLSSASRRAFFIHFSENTLAPWWQLATPCLVVVEFSSYVRNATHGGYWRWLRRRGPVDARCEACKRMGVCAWRYSMWFTFPYGCGVLVERFGVCSLALCQCGASLETTFKPSGLAFPFAVDHHQAGIQPSKSTSVWSLRDTEVCKIPSGRI